MSNPFKFTWAWRNSSQKFTNVGFCIRMVGFTNYKLSLGTPVNFKRAKARLRRICSDDTKNSMLKLVSTYVSTY
jgi:tRNA(Leu) C34 or U34 (ribose-2'-O)-methylase TrmL